MVNRYILLYALLKALYCQYVHTCIHCLKHDNILFDLKYKEVANVFEPFIGPPAVIVNIVKNTETLSVVVQWDEVDDSLPTTYVVTWTSERGHTEQSPGLVGLTSYTITGLTLDTVYNITVRATNRCGIGPTSTASVNISTGTTYVHTSIICICTYTLYCKTFEV